MLKSYFLVFNITCKAQLNNKFNEHHAFHLLEGLLLCSNFQGVLIVYIARYIE